MRARAICGWSMLIGLGACAWMGCGSSTTTSEPTDAAQIDAGADGSTPPSGDASATSLPTSDAGGNGGDASPTSDGGAPSDAMPAADTGTTPPPTDAGSDTTTSAACAPAPSGWRPMASAPVAATERFANFGFATWTGKEVLVLRNGLRSGENFVAAYAYDPVADTWRTLATPPFKLAYRGFAVSAWTGSQWLLYGEYPHDLHGDATSNGPGGFAWDAASNTWSALDRPPVSDRWSMMGAWDASSKTVLMFGGAFTHYDGTWNEYADGVRYDPVAKTWTKIADMPFAGSQARLTWSAGRLVVALPGRHLTAGDRITHYAEMAAYDPTANAWSAMTPPSDDPELFARALSLGADGRDIALWFDGSAAFDASSLSGAGRWWDPSTSTWHEIPSLFAPTPAGARRGGPAAWSANGKLYAWGGYDAAPPGTARADGAWFDPATGVVTALPTEGAPTARFETTTIWTGCDAIVLGGSDETGTDFTDGRRFRP